MMRALSFSTTVVPAPETRCTAHAQGGEIRVRVVARVIVRPACGAVVGMGLAAPMT